MGRNGHDGAGAVGRQNIIRYPHRDPGAVERVQGVSAGENAGLILFQLGAFHIGFAGRRGYIGVDRGFPVRGGYFRHQGMFRGKDHIGGAVDSIGTGGEDRKRLVRPGQREFYFSAFGAAYPVLLHMHGGRRPVQAFQILQQAVGVGGDLQHPLPYFFTFDRGFAALTAALVDFFVSQACFTFGTPVDGHGGLVSQALFEKPQEDPLCPAVIVGGSCIEFLVPVIAETQRVYLPLEIFAVLFCGYLRVHAGADGVVLRRQAESVPAHRVQHVEAPHPLVAAQDV